MECGKEPSPLTEHLGEISVPIIFAGGVGGNGENMFYTATQTAGTDITKVMVQVLEDDMRQQDFAHVDTIMARDAETLTWKPILNWLMEHR
jgi:hypothetical protein